MRAGSIGRLLSAIAITVAGSLPVAAYPHRDAKPAPDASQAGEEQRFVLLCMAALLTGDTSTAEASCGEALTLNPRDVSAYKLRGYAFLVDHRFERAEEDFRNGLQMQPSDHEMLAGLGESLAGQGSFHDAVRYFSKAVALAPGRAAYWNARCWARGGEGVALKAAISDCNRALKLSPGAPAPLNSRGMVQLKLKQFAAAIADYDAALKARPSQPSARFGRGLARLWMADAKEGVADIREARRQESAVDDLFVMLGVLPATCHLRGENCPPDFPAPFTIPEPDYKAVTVSQDSDDVFLGLEIGRLELMLDQIARLAGRPDLAHHAEDTAAGEQESLVRIQLAIERFNTLLPVACRRAKLHGAVCATYQPVLFGNMTEAAGAADDLFLHVFPVWSAVCRGHRSRCQLE